MIEAVSEMTILKRNNTVIVSLPSNYKVSNVIVSGDEIERTKAVIIVASFHTATPSRAAVARA